MNRLNSKNLLRTILQIKKEKEERKAILLTEERHLCQFTKARTKGAMKRITQKYSKEVHFNDCEIKMLLCLFQEMGECDVEGTVSEDDFKSFLSAQFDITCTKSLNGILRAFKIGRGKDLTAEDFLLGFSVFLRGNIKEKAKFTFKAFDIDGDGFLRRKDEFSSYLQDTFDPSSEAVLSEIDPDEPSREMGNYLWFKFLHNSDKTEIDLQTFTGLCLEESILLECLTTIFPPESKIMTFQRLLFCNVHSQMY